MSASYNNYHGIDARKLAFGLAHVRVNTANNDLTLGRLRLSVYPLDKDVDAAVFLSPLKKHILKKYLSQYLNMHGLSLGSV